MLVLSRKTNESIVIDGNITISVLQVKGKIVRLGIEAPKEIPIRRKELRELTVARDLFVEFA
jgi:carbon storage regulator